MDFSKMNDNSGTTAEERIQAEFGGDNTMLIFVNEGETTSFH